MTKRTAPRSGARDVDYTVTGIIVIVAIVVITAVFLARPSTVDALPGSTLGGKAFDAGGTAVEPSACEQSSFCDGTRLVRQGADCRQYEAFCTYGCSYRDGHAVCNS
jgi:hypothetical protein